MSSSIIVCEHSSSYSRLKNQFCNKLNGIYIYIYVCFQLERALEVERITNVELRKKVSTLREQRQMQ